MSGLSSLILGIIEGVTEFLPISSTAHLRLFSQWLGVANTNFSKSFDIIIQLGAILAVLVIYCRTLWQKSQIILKLAVAFLPTAVIGLLAYPLVKGVFMDSFWLMAATLGLGGVFLLWFEGRYNEQTVKTVDLEQISYKQAFIIGLCQSIAIIPGVSRSAATIVGGLALGLQRSVIVEFSFLLALPTMAAATGLDLLKSSWSWGTNEIVILSIGLVAAFVTAWLTVRWLLGFVQKRDFKPFGWYRVGLAIVIILYLLIR